MANSRSAERYHKRVPSFEASATAYIGADGHIDVSQLDDDTLNDDTFDSSPAKTSRPALSTRLLSSLPSQPAAAAALTRSKSLLHSRAKSLAAWTSTFTPIAENPTTNRLFGDFFSGESAPVRLGVQTSSPSKEETEFVMDYRPSFTQRSSFASRRRILLSQDTSTTRQGSNSHNSTTRPSWFSRKSGGSSTALPVDDDLLNLNINNALFPNGPADSFSPSDFNDLLLNATRLLERMQTAYREKVEFIASVQPEIDAQKEEVEEAETRAQHLKMQLENMGRKAQDQEAAMSQLAAELAEERMLSRARTTRTGTANEDDTTPRSRRKRGSAGSASDSGFESDLDRDTESVIASGIPTPRTPPAVFTGSPFDNLDQRLHDRNIKLQRQAPLRAIDLGYGKSSDDNAAKWNTIQQLRGENHGLRSQMELMQQTLQDCIEFVDTVHI